MTILAILLLIVWAVGIVFICWGAKHVLETDTSLEMDMLRVGLRRQPLLVGGIVAVLIAFWPASLIYAVLTNKTKETN